MKGLGWSCRAHILYTSRPQRDEGNPSVSSPIRTPHRGMHISLHVHLVKWTTPQQNLITCINYIFIERPILWWDQLLLRIRHLKRVPPTIMDWNRMAHLESMWAPQQRCRYCCITYLKQQHEQVMVVGAGITTTFFLISPESSQPSDSKPWRSPTSIHLHLTTHPYEGK